jgi:dihydroorotate dehydrogenase electron transfer subunit
MKQFNARVLRNRRICLDFYEMSFDWDAGAGLPGPGQFFTVRVSRDPIPLLRRPFAFSSYSRVTGAAAMIYQRRGRGTEILCARQKGDEIDVLGPLGRHFPLPESGRKALLVAGGIGVGPILFLARVLRQLKCEYRVIFGCKTAALVPGMRSFTSHEPQLCTDDGSAGFRGTTGDFLKSIERTVGTDTVLYACGPMAMLKTCHDFSARRGIVCHVSVEQIMACGVGACMGCAIRSARGGYVRVCTEGPVFESNEIIWG